MPDLYEVVDGRVAEKPAMGAYETWFTVQLHTHLVLANANPQLGVFAAEPLLMLNREANLCRRPDLAFISFDRWPLDREVGDEPAWDVVPDLAIEVVSPTNLAEEVARKALE